MVALPLALSLAASGEPPFPIGRWIAPPKAADPQRNLPLIRKEFSLDSRPERALLRVIGLGDYDPSVNGVPLSKVGMNQPWSQYERTLYYRDFDLTPHLRTGANCVGIALYNSFWHNPDPPAGRYNKSGPQRSEGEPWLVRAEIVWESKGKVSRIGSDASWQTTPGPVAFSHVFAGEDYDARAARKGWDRAGTPATGWVSVREVEGPASELLPYVAPLIEPDGKSLLPATPAFGGGVWRYTFPRNVAGQLRAVLKGGASGAKVSFRSGEHRSPEGRLFGHYDVATEIVTDGARVDRRWRSFYLGLQFVEVSGAVPPGQPNPEGLPVLERLELLPVRSALPVHGLFRSSSEVLDGTHRIVDAAMRSNSSWVLTDCPHREKLGWLECAHLLAPSFLYRYDSARWFRKIFRDISDAQLPDGNVPTVAPNYPAGRFPGAFSFTVEWGAAATLGPWEVYRWTGDEEVLRENFAMMRRFTDWITSASKDGIAPGGLGDWYDYGHGQPPGPSRYTPVELSATAMWAMCADATARAAEALGRKEERDRYRALHQRIAADFRRHFMDPSTGAIRNSGSVQCGNAMALCAGIVPESERPRRVDEIIEDLRKRDWQQTPGDIGHVYLIRALAEAGRSDILHKVYARDGLGSYGGILKKGLTSMPETWDAMMDGYQSLNHCMLGHVMEWLYGYVGGIRQAPGSVGWKRAVIGPVPGSLRHGSAATNTPLGRIQSTWTIGSGRFRLVADVPAGIEAEAWLPSGAKRKLRPGRQVVTELYREP